MGIIKSLILAGALLLPFFAVATSSAEEDCIIDPNLMNKDTWSEPIFSPSVAENSRAPASATQGNVVAVRAEKNSDQYLEVQKIIPQSEPSLTQATVQWKVNSED